MKKRFERDSAEPLYQQIASRLKMEISSGTYPVGKKLPSETELCIKYEVSRITIRRAMDELAKTGAVVRKQGKGTFVSQAKEKVNPGSVKSFHEKAISQGKIPSSRVISARTIPASPFDIHSLKLPERSRVVEIKRVRMADGIPVLVEINHFGMVYSYLLENELTGSLYELISQYGIEPFGATREISLVNADSQTAEALAIAEGSSVMLLNETVFDQKGRPLHTSRQYVRGDIFTLKI